MKDQGRPELDGQFDKLEERIIAYFDGELSGPSEKALLEEIRQTPDGSAARALFESHESLNRMISAARAPIETPLEVKRSIAERIPGLISYLPHIFGAAAGSLQTAPLLTQSVNPIVGFFSKLSLSTVLTVTTSVAVLTTAGIVVKNKLDDDAKLTARKPHAVVHQAAPGQAPAFTTPENNIAEGGANAAPSSAASNDASNRGSRDASGAAAIDGSSKIAGVASNSGASHSGSSARTAERVSEDGTSHRAALPSRSVGHMYAHAAAKNASDVARHAGRVGTVDGSSNAASKSEASKSEALKNVASDNSSSNNVSASANATSPELAAIPPTEPKPLQSVVYAGGSKNILLPYTTVSLPGEHVAWMHPFAATYAEMMFVPGVRGLVPGQERNVASGDMGFAVSLGFDIPVTDALAVRVVGGSQSFVVLRNETMKEQGGVAGLDRYVGYSHLANVSALTSRAGLAYTFDLSSIRLVAAATAGAAWVGPTAPMAGLSLAAEWNISPSSMLRPGVTFDMAWVRNGGDREHAQASGIFEDRELQASSLTNALFGVGIGFSYRP